MKAEQFTFIVRNGSKHDGVRFVVEYPEFPGITGGSDDLFEAIKEAQEALQMFIDYRTNEKRSIVEKKSGRVTLRLPSTTHKLCEEYAKYEGVSLNTFLISAITEKIYSYKKKDVVRPKWISTHSDNNLNAFQTTYKGVHKDNGKTRYVC
jgi:predicted HicB family RNase H-like nuclease